MTEKEINNAICPLCNSENRCQVDQPQTCWCFNTKIPEELLAELPNDLRNKACICRNCVDAFMNKNS